MDLYTLFSKAHVVCKDQLKEYLFSSMLVKKRSTHATQENKRNKKKRSIYISVCLNVYWHSNASSPFQCNYLFRVGMGFDLNNATDKRQRTLKRTQGKGERRGLMSFGEKLKLKSLKVGVCLGSWDPPYSVLQDDPFLTLNYSSTLSLIFPRLLLLFWSFSTFPFLLSCLEQKKTIQQF